MEPIHPVWTCWGTPVDSLCIAHSGMICRLLYWNSLLHCDSCHFILSVLWQCHKCRLMRPPWSSTDLLLVPAVDITASAKSVSPWTNVSVWTKGDSTVWCQLGYQHCPIFLQHLDPNMSFCVGLEKNLNDRDRAVSKIALLNLESFSPAWACVLWLFVLGDEISTKTFSR